MVDKVEFNQVMKSNSHICFFLHYNILSLAVLATVFPFLLHVIVLVVCVCVCVYVFVCVCVCERESVCPISLRLVCVYVGMKLLVAPFCYLRNKLHSVMFVFFADKAR